MKVQSFVLCFLLTLLSVSCIREEAPNAEADILSCTVDGDILENRAGDRQRVRDADREK